MTTPLTAHFALEEFTVSATHPELVEPVPPEYLSNVRRLAGTILEPIRLQIDRPIRVLSGYRPDKLNRAIGGSPTSQHRRAEAADFTTEHIEDVFRLMVGQVGTIHCGQCIYYPSRRFIHVALPSSKYPIPSFHIHEPSRGYKYQKLGSEGELDVLLRAVA